MHMSTMKESGKTVSFRLFLKYWYPRAPKSAGSTLSNAGRRTGLSRTGVKGIRRRTPMNITSIVTREEVATESVDIISFSLLPTSASAISLAFAAQGSFRFVMFPVMNER